MKTFKFVLRMVNVIVLLVIVCTVLVSFKKEVTTHLIFNHGLTKIESGPYIFKEKLLNLRFACGGVQWILEPNICASSSDEPSFAEWSLRFYSYPEYPYVHPAELDDGNRSVLDIRHQPVDLWALGFQYTQIRTQEFKGEKKLADVMSFQSLTLPSYALLLPWIFFTGRANRRRYLNWRKKKRISRGHCGFCDYDLRGEQKICPECGRAATMG